MAHFLIIAFYCLLLGSYGYFLYRKVNQRYYTIMNLLAAAASLGYAYIFKVGLYNLGISSDYVSSDNLSFLLQSWFVFLILVSAGAVWGMKLIGFSEVFWRIPLGTALAEEIMFRGVLFGLLLMYYGHGLALILSSLLFGLWHILPNPMSNWANQNLAQSVVKNWRSRNLPTVLTILVSAGGGLVFGLLRSASIAAPWLAHITTNLAGRLAETSGLIQSRKVTYNKG